MAAMVRLAGIDVSKQTLDVHVMPSGESRTVWYDPRGLDELRQWPLDLGVAVAAVEAGLVPISVGLVASSATIIARTVDHDWIFVAITAVSTAVLLRFRIHPLWMLALGAAVGWTGFGQ